MASWQHNSDVKPRTSQRTQTLDHKQHIIKRETEIYEFQQDAYVPEVKERDL